MQTIKPEIWFSSTDSIKVSDIYCAYCNYTGDIKIKKHNWITYKNPNYDMILKKYKGYLKYLDLCPGAIKFINDQIIYFQCPKCQWSRLHVALDSIYNLSNIELSLNCHATLI